MAIDTDAYLSSLVDYHTREEEPERDPDDYYEEDR